MRTRSITATLALAFGITTLAVFALVGSFLYRALERQISAQDDLGIVLAVRHARRLVQEIDTSRDIREHADRIASAVFGNPAMSMEVFGPDGQLVVEHNLDSTLGASAVVAGNSTSSPQFSVTRIPNSARVTEASIESWSNSNGVPIRGIVADAELRDGEVISMLIARNMSDRYWV